MATVAELVLASAPKRPTVEQVAGLMEADLAAKEQAAREAVREQKRRQRIEREKARREAEARGERMHDTAAAGMRKVAGR